MSFPAPNTFLPQDVTVNPVEDGQATPGSSVTCAPLPGVARSTLWYGGHNGLMAQTSPLVG